MFIFTIYRVIKFASQGFFRNFWLSIVTISVIVLAFISINILIIINIIASSATQYIQNKIDMSVYFKNDVDEQTILEVKNSLETLSQVEKVDYVSKNSALEYFRNKHKYNTIILESLEEIGENPLSGTLKVKSKNMSDYPVIMDYLNNSKYNVYILDKNFNDNKSFIERIDIIASSINKFGAGAIVIFTIISILIVFNTIKLTMYAQREEIAIMKFVGASNFFISSPYIIESMFYSLCAFAISTFILFSSMNIIQPYVVNYFQGMLDLKILLFKNLHMIFGSELIGVVILNIMASTIAVRRYLKV